MRSESEVRLKCLDLMCSWDEWGKVFKAYFCAVGGFAPVCLDEDMLHFWMAWWNIREDGKLLLRGLGMPRMKHVGFVGWLLMDVVLTEFYATLAVANASITSSLPHVPSRVAV
ncbi:hypothetical protein VNO80_15472 [Phaseolus coccineus]|uniref:Uncharacterized protein n=1 Tax=Phaseolus coccineus TaxID=3886 RepID=A0AAN9MJX8_PHACN